MKNYGVQPEFIGEDLFFFLVLTFWSDLPPPPLQIGLRTGLHVHVHVNCSQSTKPPDTGAVLCRHASIFNIYLRVGYISINLEMVNVPGVGEKIISREILCAPCTLRHFNRCVFIFVHEKLLFFRIRFVTIIANPLT